MPKLTLFPLGNADCCRIDLDSGASLLFDYANTRSVDDKTDRRIDLPATLRADLRTAKRDGYDVVAFTHLDTDHICGATEFFELEHAKKYQGGGRVKMPNLWVPAFVITEEGCTDEARVIQAEARYRLKQGRGIRVFSRPDALEAWLAGEGLTVNDRRSLITDAGHLVPGWSLATHGVEFFVHSPFAHRHDDGTFDDRNTNCLVVQATFRVQQVETCVLLLADATHEVLSEIVDITRAHRRHGRLRWDLNKIPHHTSYLSIGPEKGDTETAPVPNVQWLFETQGQSGAIMVSTSDVIPSSDSEQPPHRQAGAYYRRRVAGDKGRQFHVTMEHPSASSPKPLVVKIDAFGATLERANRPIGGGAIATPAPRAG
jgi:hypothetical protein